MFDFIFDFRKVDINSHGNIVINGENVERVQEYKYLGVVFDEKLGWKPHCDKVTKQLNSRLFLMRKLNEINIDSKLLTMYYQSCIISILIFCISVWGGNITCQYKNKMNKSLKYACKMLGRTDSCDSFENIYKQMCNKTLNKIFRDDSHPLNHKIVFGRSGRILHRKCRTTRYLNSFLPSSIRNFHICLL